MARIYLAGPDVFLPQPLARAAALKAICARHGLVGVSPLDALAGEPADWGGLPEARRIALRNETHIRSCDALVANLTPFRGPSADAGTVFELGFMRALGRPVFGWSNCAEAFSVRSRSFVGPAARQDDQGWRDGAGMLIEDFGLGDNLMLDGAIVASGGVMVVADVPAEAWWEDLDACCRCLEAVAARF